MKSFESKTLTPEQEKFKPISWRIEDRIGKFSMVEDKNGSVKIEIENRAGKKFQINSLLPRSYDIAGSMFWKNKWGYGELDREPESSFADIPAKKIIVSQIEAGEDGWKYLLAVLHEIGHIIRAEKHPEESKEKAALYQNQPAIWNDTRLLKRAEILTSRDERDSWAFAIRELRKLAKNLDLPIKEIFKDAKSIKSYINKCLGSYKEAALSLAGALDVPIKEKEKLLEELGELFVREK